MAARLPRGRPTVCSPRQDCGERPSAGKPAEEQLPTHGMEFEISWATPNSAEPSSQGNARPFYTRNQRFSSLRSSRSPISTCFCLGSAARRIPQTPLRRVQVHPIVKRGKDVVARLQALQQLSVDCTTPQAVAQRLEGVD